MFISLISVSRRATFRVVSVAEMNQIAARLSKRNARLRVRGALLVTRRHAAQLLEGPEEAIDDLVAAARRDTRLADITVVHRKLIDGYSFADWCFAYWGTASYIDEKISSVLERRTEAARTDDTAQLDRLIHLMAIESRKQYRPIGKPPIF